MAPNIIYIHTHDTGRYVSPYGYAVPTPNIDQLARDGVLFRKAHCAAPTCSPSRASLLTGNSPHENGMIGLMHRGARLNDPSQHLANVLKSAGYESVMCGFQHVAPDDELAELGYSTVIQSEKNRAAQVAPLAAAWLKERDDTRPFFLSVGFTETHRVYPDNDPQDDPRYVAVPPGYPDLPDIRLDTARLHTSLRAVDAAVGEVLAAVAQAGLSENTLVIFTTDHGLPWPGAKCNLGDSGTGVALIMRGPDGFSGGQMVDALVSQVDIFPTLTGLAGLPPSPWVRGKSLVPLVQGETDEVRDEIFAEVTCHAAYEPMRAIRTRDWLYIRRFSNRHSPVLANVDDGDAKRIFLNNGWENVHLADRQLYNVILDPFETRNLADDPERKAIVLEMDDRLNAWMSATDDPLLDPTWQPPAHFRLEPSG